MSGSGGFDRGKSLEELEQEDWGEPTYDSYLMTTVHRLRRKPLAEFTVEDLRILIGQRISLAFLVPLAMERLEEEPLAAGDFYPGDLLHAVLRVGEDFWASHPDSGRRARGVIARARALVGSLDEIDRPSVLDILAGTPRSLTSE